MLATPLLARLGGRLLAPAGVRHRRKTCRLETGYGLEPLHQASQLEEAAREPDGLDRLRFERVRFAQVHENGSPLYDGELEHFTRYVMKGGAYGLASRLMSDTFYEIKCQQILRARKKAATSAAGHHQEAPAAPAADPNQANNNNNPLLVFRAALRQAEPVLVTKKVKRGGAIYQVPYPLTRGDSEYYARKWFLQAVRDRPKPRSEHFGEAMAREMLAAAANTGKVVKRKDDMHRLAGANKAFAHYRWG